MKRTSHVAQPTWWKTAASVITIGDPQVIDFTTLLNGTIDGLTHTTITENSITFDTDAAQAAFGLAPTSNSWPVTGAANILSVDIISPVTAVVPSAQATLEGNLTNQFPFNPRSVGVSTLRYQQVHDSSEFSPGRQRISQIACRPDGHPTTPLVGTIGNVEDRAPQTLWPVVR